MSEYKRQVEMIDHEIKELKEKRMLLMAKWNDSENPMKIGHEIDLNESVTMRVHTTSVKYIPAIGFYFSALGNVIKKNGEVGLITREVTKPA